MKRLIAVALMISLPLSACSMDTYPTNSPSASASTSATATIQPTKPVVTSTLIIQPSLTATVSATSTPTTTKIAIKTYRMDEKYDIVPIDPNGNKKVLLLTFDDGPKDKSMIEPMLDILEKHNAKAIFFLNGYRIKQKPELLKLLHERGQIIGNHAWDHIQLKKETNEKIDQQLRDVQVIVKEITGNTPVFFRPPFASYNNYVKAAAKSEKMLFMTWSNGSLDWDLENKGFSVETKAAAVITNIMKLLHSGSNILMHELPWTVQALDDLLTQLEAKGYTFVDPQSIDTEME